MTMKSEIIDLSQLGSPEVKLAEHEGQHRSKRLNVKFDLSAIQPTYTVMVWNRDAAGVIQAVPEIATFATAEAAVHSYNRN